MNRLPKVKYRSMSFNENMDMIAMFIDIEKDKDSKSNTIYFKNKYSKINDIDFSNMNRDQIKEILLLNLYDNWIEEMKNSDEIITEYQTNWDLINDEVMKSISNKLNIDWPSDLINIEARVGVMYCCPRFINNRTFDLFIGVNSDVVREITIHEICHFLFFEKWKELFNDFDENHYNSPNIIWYLSEALIDPLLNNDAFKNFTSKEIRSYDFFYNLFIDGENVIDLMNKIIKKESIEKTIIKCYKILLDNEALIISSDKGIM